jgi:hypothetical protein
MATRTWVGSVVNNNWTTAANWNGGLTIPTNGDDVIFDGLAPLGNNNCTYNVGVALSLLSINFTGYTGQFTFSNSLTVTGTITLGAGSSYATSGTPTTYTLTTSTATTLTFNGKSLPVNYSPGTSGTQTFFGNADFQGNYAGPSSGYNIKAAATTTIDLRIGGNIVFGACTTNPTDYVTIKAYGASKTFAANTATVNQRVTFASGSSYSNLSIPGCSGTNFYTVESGGRFNANTAYTMTNGGTLTLSGFNSTTSIIGSDFMSMNGQGTYILSDDTIIKGAITIGTLGGTISGAGKLLLEGNFTVSGGNTLTIDKLEFSGTTTSTVSATSTNNLQIKALSFNKTGAGLVNFTSASFILTIPTATAYTWTHTSGTITQSVNSRIIIACAATTSQLTYSESGSLSTPFTFSQLSINGGILSLNSTLRATRLYLTLGLLTTSITSSGTLGFIVDILTAINSVAGTRTLTLKSGCTYDINVNLNMQSLNAATGQITLNASVVSGTKAYFNLDNNASQLVEYVNATDIDSSGTLGVAPYTKQLIYSFQGTLTRFFNWATGTQPPPVLPSRTAAYTFVN